MALYIGGTRIYKVDVREKGGVPDLQTKSISITPISSAQSQTVTPDSAYDGLSSVIINTSAIPAGAAATPATSITASPSISVNSETGLITAVASNSVSITPTITPGYVSSGIDGEVTVSGSNTYQMYVKSGRTITPTASEQSVIPAGTFVTGEVKVEAMPPGIAGDPILVIGQVQNNSIDIKARVTNAAGYISSGVLESSSTTITAAQLATGTVYISKNGTVDVTNCAQAVVNVPTSGGLNVQFYMGSAEVVGATYAATTVTLTVATTGVYTVSWDGARNTTSGTSGSQLYINGSAYGSAQTTFTHNFQNVILSGVSLTAGDVLVIYARSRNDSYYMNVGNLIIKQTA